MPPLSDEGGMTTPQLSPPSASGPDITRRPPWLPERPTADEERAALTALYMLPMLGTISAPPP
jgi:hypothetical protein